MKRISVILLFTIYCLAAFGVSIKQFYCCGALKSTTIGFVDEFKKSCVKGDQKDSCCKTTYRVFKVKENHVTASEINSPVNPFADLHLPIAFTYTFTAFAENFVHKANGTHAPPLLSGVPVYVFNCTYLI